MHISLRLLSLLSILLFSTAVMAHPHSWISQQTRLVGNDNGITAIEMVWTFDTQTTAYTLDGEDLSTPELRDQALEQLTKQIIHHMTPSHYFTYFYDGKTPIRFYPVKKAQLTLMNHELILTFTLNLSKPQPYNSHDLSLLIYDPTYFVDMFWDKPHDVSLGPTVAKHCKTRLIDPSPSSKDASYAASLPPEVDPDFNLGELFAQRLHLTCHP